MSTPDLPTDLPDAWRELIAGLVLLARGRKDNISPLHCEHDTLTVLADPGQFTPEEIAQLGAWGFHTDDEGVFYSFRFGSA